MITPIDSIVSGNAGVQAQLGSAPCRFWAHGQAPQNSSYPYATWNLIAATPENLLSETPPCDAHRVQVDVWARNATEADAAAQAIRDCLEARGSMIAFSTDRDPSTGAFRISADYLLWFNR